VANGKAFSGISRKEDNHARATQNFLLDIFVPFDFSPVISGIFGEMVRISEFNDFQIFQKLSKEISIPFAPVSKVLVLVKW